jgi:hypothetical protein
VDKNPCLAIHPERGRCRRTGPHAWHYAGYGVDQVRWQNEEWVEPIANTPRNRLARVVDPPSSHGAAARIEPKTGTRMAKVLAYLTEHPGWVNGEVLNTPEVGGSEGTRRLRELRELGYDIQLRPNPHSDTAYQYRLSQYRLVGMD